MVFDKDLMATSEEVLESATIQTCVVIATMTHICHMCGVGQINFRKLKLLGRGWASFNNSFSDGRCSHSYWKGSECHMVANHKTQSVCRFTVH